MTEKQQPKTIVAIDSGWLVVYRDGTTANIEDPDHRIFDVDHRHLIEDEDYTGDDVMDRWGAVYVYCEICHTKRPLLWRGSVREERTGDLPLLHIHDAGCLCTYNEYKAKEKHLTAHAERLEAANDELEHVIEAMRNAGDVNPDEFFREFDTFKKRMDELERKEAMFDATVDAVLGRYEAPSR